MEGAQSRFQASPFHVLVSNEGTHKSREWASLTAGLIVQPSTEASIEARAQISNLQLRIEEELVSVFEEVDAATSQSEVVVITSQAVNRIVDLTHDTKWAAIFNSKPIRESIEELIMRNLASACDIALKVE